MHVPSTVTSTQYWGAVAASSRWNTVFEETPTVGLPGTGITQANLCGGPAYLIWMMAVTVESGLSTNTISSAERWPGASCEDREDPTRPCAPARRSVAGQPRRPAARTAIDRRTQGDRFENFISFEAKWQLRVCRRVAGSGLPRMILHSLGLADSRGACAGYLERVFEGLRTLVTGAPTQGHRHRPVKASSGPASARGSKVDVQSADVFR